MRYKQYILLEADDGGIARGKKVDEKEASKILNTKCKKSVGYYNKTGISLFRGMRKHLDFYDVDPSSRRRASAYTKNYYTLMIDNSPYWRNYPERGLSLICTTNLYKTTSYGKPYRVFAYDGANYGVAPQDDIWESFPTFGGAMLGSVNNALNELIRHFELGPVLGTKPTYQSLMDTFGLIGNSLREMETEDELDSMANNNIIVQLWLDSGKIFKDWMHEMFHPDENDFFYTKDINQIYVKGRTNKEVWTDSKALLVNEIYDYQDFEELMAIY